MSWPRPAPGRLSRPAGGGRPRSPHRSRGGGRPWGWTGSSSWAGTRRTARWRSIRSCRGRGAAGPGRTGRGRGDHRLAHVRVDGAPGHQQRRAGRPARQAPPDRWPGRARERGPARGRVRRRRGARLGRRDRRPWPAAVRRLPRSGPQRGRLPGWHLVPYRRSGPVRSRWLGTAAGLPRHKLPARLLIVDTLPRTAAGKVRKADLRHLLARPADGR